MALRFPTSGAFSFVGLVFSSAAVSCATATIDPDEYYGESVEGDVVDGSTGGAAGDEPDASDGEPPTGDGDGDVAPVDDGSGGSPTQMVVEPGVGVNPGTAAGGTPAASVADCSTLPNVLIDNFDHDLHWLTPGGGFSASWRWFSPDQTAAQPLPRGVGQGCDGTDAVQISGATTRLEVFDYGSGTPVSGAGWSGFRFAASGDGTLRFSLQVLGGNGTLAQHMDIPLTATMQVYDVPFDGATNGQQFAVITWERLGGSNMLIDNFGLF